MDSVTNQVILQLISTSIKIKNQNEFNTSLIGYPISSLGRNRERVWVISNCLTFNFLWMGTRGYRRFGYLEQSKLNTKRNGI